MVAFYAAAAGICYWIFRTESKHLSRQRALLLVFVVFLLTSVTNNVHRFSVDDTSYYFGYPAINWQHAVQDAVIQLSSPDVQPHSYRFLPNSIVRWFEMAGLEFEKARDLYRLLTGLVLFYAIYRFARLYCNYAGGLIAMLLVASIYPVSYEFYAGQLTDPLSHLSFVLAFIFLETEEFGWLVATLAIGSLAKESVLAMAGYYVLFRRQESHYFLKSATLLAVAVVSYFGVRYLVLHGVPRYDQISGMRLEYLPGNWSDPKWPAPFLLTACALVPVLILFWNQTPVSLKRLSLFLLPVLTLSNLILSWLRESGISCRWCSSWR